MRIKSRFHKYLLSLHKTFAVSSSFKLNQKPFGVFLSAVTSLSGVSCRMLFCHPSFRARERYHHSNPLRVNCRHISADHRHVETSLCFNITFLFRIHFRDNAVLMIQFCLDTKPPGQVRKRSCSGFKYLFFGRHKRGWRRLETRGITNTTSRQQPVFVFTSVSFVFYLFLASSAVSFHLLLGSLGSSSSLHLHLTPSSD